MDDITKNFLVFVIMLILLLIPMIVLLEKLKDKYKKEIKYENDKFSKYLFNNIKDSSMKQGLISTIVILSCFFLFGIVYFVLYLKLIWSEIKKNKKCNIETINKSLNYNS